MAIAISQEWQVAQVCSVCFVVQQFNRPLTEEHHLHCVAVRLNAMKRIQQAALQVWHHTGFLIFVLHYAFGEAQQCSHGLYCIDVLMTDPKMST